MKLVSRVKQRKDEWTEPYLITEQNRTEQNRTEQNSTALVHNARFLFHKKEKKKRPKLCHGSVFHLGGL